MDSLKETLIQRDGISADEAELIINEARDELYNRLSDGEMPFSLCDELFGLEPDYLEDLMY